MEYDKIMEYHLPRNNLQYRNPQVVFSAMHKYYLLCISLSQPSSVTKMLWPQEKQLSGKILFLHSSEKKAADRNRGRDLRKHNTGAVLWIPPEVGNVTFMLSCSC